MANIIFLDFDGVLNNNDSWLLYGTSDRLNPIAMGLLAKAVKEFDLKIVVSSVWRGYGFSVINHIFDQYDIGSFEKSPFYGYSTLHMLQPPYRNPFDDNDYKEWRTPRGNTPETINQDRSIEIELWLKEYLKPEDKYVILDDERFQFDKHEMCKNNFIHCPDGFNSDAYFKLEKFFSK